MKKSGFYKLWAIIFTIIIILLVSLGIVLYKQNGNKNREFRYEVYDRIPLELENSIVSKDSLKSNVKKLAIIIDDLGWNKEIAKAFLDIDASISFSILPNLKFSKAIADEAGFKGRDVLLHLPMEPHGDIAEPPFLKQLTDKMDKDDMNILITDYISSIPHIVGVNNHMGSKFTENGQYTKYVMEILKNKNLFFIDSFTTPKSMGYQTAKKSGVKTARRNVFLDNIEDEEYIKGQIEKLINLSQKNGFAIGIGHPHHQTLSALQKMVAVIKEKGIEIVPVSELVN